MLAINLRTRVPRLSLHLDVVSNDEGSQSRNDPGYHYIYSRDNCM